MRYRFTDKELKKIDNFSGIIKGSKQYLKCHFAVKDSEWTGMGMVAKIRKIEATPSFTLPQ